MNTTKPTDRQVPPATFYGLGIAPNLLIALENMKFHTPTPIQYKTIPLALDGQDIIGVAQTGTGKTLAFGIPMLQKLAQKKGRGLVLVPTRELAIQVYQSLSKIDPKTKLAVLIGGAPINKQSDELSRDPKIIIATPGRLIDHMGRRRTLLKDVVVLILDEADRMLDLGFTQQIQTILRDLPSDRQTMLFSATIPQQIMRLATSYMKLPIQVEIAKSGTVAERITQELFIVKKEAKNELLHRLLDEYHGTILVFSRTKRGASRLAQGIRKTRHSAAEIHSDRTLSQRREALEGFRSGKYRVLVATDIAARGLDVFGIELVINYDLPDESENYVHRIGRTGRAGDQGHAISFAAPDQERDIRNIEKLMLAALPISEHPKMPLEKFLELPPTKMVYQTRRTNSGRRRRGPSPSSSRRSRPS